jgi:hypothetical protein
MGPFTDRSDGTLFHHAWTRQVQDEPPGTALDSPLLDLVGTSDVNPIPVEQFRDARRALRLRRDLVESGRGDPDEVLAVQRQIVERYLEGRRAYFGYDQCAPFGEVDEMAREGRDTFVVIKFMDEAPHIAATLHSLLHQKDVDPHRLVVVAVDNNSTDGSDRIVEGIAAANRSPVRIVSLGQPRPGAGNAARLGVDGCIATIHEMCRRDQAWERLQSAVIGVSDGDTVYHPHLVAETLRIFESSPTVDGAMPFLIYKLTAALRLFAGYQPAFPEALEARAVPGEARELDVDLTDLTAFDRLPRWGRERQGEAMRLAVEGGAPVTVPLAATDEHGRRFGTLRDRAGHVAYVLHDRTLVLARAPVSGFDAALVFLENGGVRPEQRWRWHAVVAHDLFLYWAFAGMGLPAAMVYPDTSDALKMFRTWSFAIGGQHQLARPDLRIATGSDYQSGRVLQAAGATVRLGPARAFAETETDRLIKMVRNLVHQQSVFYGETRSEPLDRATGLYVHMTRIQSSLEQELRDYDDEVFERVVFPERVLFPLRWILQNAVRFYAHPEPAARRIVRERALDVMFSAATARRLERTWLNDDAVTAIRAADCCEKQAVAERIAEAVIGENYAEIMAFYCRTLRSFFTAQRVASDCYEALLEGVETSRNAIIERPPAVHPAVVWQGSEFVIDVRRGQVVRMRTEA